MKESFILRVFVNASRHDAYTSDSISAAGSTNSKAKDDHDNVDQQPHNKTCTDQRDQQAEESKQDQRLAQVEDYH